MEFLGLLSGLFLGLVLGYILGRDKVRRTQREVCDVCRARRDFVLSQMCERCKVMEPDERDAAKMWDDAVDN